jgi:hypothetical protein
VLGIGLAAPAGAGEDRDSSSTSQCPQSEKPEGDGILGPGGTNLGTAADVLGLEVDHLLHELADGNTLGQLARARDVDQVVLVRALLEEQERRLGELLGGRG